MIRAKREPIGPLIRAVENALVDLRTARNDLMAESGKVREAAQELVNQSQRVKEVVDSIAEKGD